MDRFQVVAYRCKPLVMWNYPYIVVHYKGCLYLLNSKDGSKRIICKLPMSYIKRIFIQFRLLERLFRLEPRIAIRLGEDHILLSYQGGMYRVNMKDNSIILEHQYHIGMNNPLDVCYIKNIPGFKDCIAYGEYSGNISKGEVSIYTRGLEVNDPWVKAYEFPKNSITHIHSIIPDHYRNCAIILTGDEDSESGIWIAKNNFQEIKQLLGGSQQYRSCCAYPTEEGILYATDTPLNNNNIYLIREAGKEWICEKINDLNGSCIYSTFWKDQYIFSTTVEPDSTIKGKRYLITYKLGKGIKSNNVEIIKGNLKIGYHCLITFKKDIYPMTLFQFGAAQFLKDNESDTLFMYLVAVKKYDGKLIAYTEDRYE